MPHDAAVNGAIPGQPDRLLQDLVQQTRLKAAFRWVRRVIQVSMEALEPYDLTAEDMGSIEIVLAEALNSVFEHANPKRKRAR